jgi:hypothetical protein
MRRVMVTVGVVVGLVTLISAAPPPAPAPALPVSLSQKLSQRVEFDGINDPRTTLDAALDKLAKLSDVTFEINSMAFEMDQLKEVGRAPVAETPIPPMRNTLATVLRKILRRVPAPSGTTYLIRRDVIEITTGMFQHVEVWGGYDGPKFPLVDVVLEKTPLEEAVKELANQSGFNVVLDNKAGDTMKTPLTAKMLNTPLDTALRLLADMTDMGVVHLDNVLYVTAKANAAALEARLKKEEHPIGDTSFPEGLKLPPWRKGGLSPIITPGGVRRQGMERRPPPPPFSGREPRNCAAWSVGFASICSTMLICWVTLSGNLSLIASINDLGSTSPNSNGE